MNAPRLAPPMHASLSLALHVLAAFCGTAKARAALSLWRSDAAPLAYLGAWLTADLFFALAHDEGAPSLDHGAALLRAHGYTTQGDAPVKLSRALADALASTRATHTQIEAPAAGLYADCLPAAVTHARLSAPKFTSRAVDATAFRALFAGPWSLEVDAYRTLAPAPNGQSAGVFVIAGHGWRAILRTVDVEGLDRPPPPFKPELPAVLVCAQCQTTGGYYKSEGELYTGARRRRWTLHETDEGAVHTCARCGEAQPAQEGAAP